MTNKRMNLVTAALTGGPTSKLPVTVNFAVQNTGRPEVPAVTFGESGTPTASITYQKVGGNVTPFTTSVKVVAPKGTERKFIRVIPMHAGGNGSLRGSPHATDAKKTLFLLLLSPFKGFFFALAFPVIVIVTVISGAWTKRKELQMRLERDHNRAVAFLLSFVEGVLYVAAFPLIIIGALIKKIALGKMTEQRT